MYSIVYIKREAPVRQTTFTELRRHAKDYFDAVEAGDVVRVYRNGRPIADIVPIPQAEPAWKRPVERLTVRGARVSEMVIEERGQEPAPPTADPSTRGDRE